MTKLLLAKPLGKAAKAKAGGWAAFTDGGTAPRWATAARVVMVIAFAATIPTSSASSMATASSGRSRSRRSRSSG